MTRMEATSAPLRGRLVWSRAPRGVLAVHDPSDKRARGNHLEFVGSRVGERVPNDARPQPPIPVLHRNVGAREIERAGPGTTVSEERLTTAEVDIEPPASLVVLDEGRAGHGRIWICIAAFTPLHRSSADSSRQTARVARR